MIQTDLVIAAKPSRLVEPTKSALHDPPLGQNLEALGVVTSSYNLQPQFAERAQLFDPFDQGSEVAAVGPNNLHSLIHRHQQSDQALGRIPVLHRSRGDR